MRRVTQINNLLRRNMITHHYNQHRMLFGGPTRMLQCSSTNNNVFLSNIKSALAEVANEELPALNKSHVKLERDFEVLSQKISALTIAVERLVPTALVRMPVVAADDKDPTVSSSDVFELCGKQWVLQMFASPTPRGVRGLYLFPRGRSEEERLRIKEGGIIFAGGRVVLTPELPHVVTAAGDVPKMILEGDMSESNYWGGDVPFDISPFIHTTNPSESRFSRGSSEHLLVKVQFPEFPFMIV